MSNRVDSEAVERMARDADEGELDYDDPVGSVLRALLAERDALESELKRFQEERSYIVGFNDGWSAALEEWEKNND